MNLKVYGEISAYYVQTLCLIFFPGEHFPVSDAENEELTCTVSVEMRPEGAFSSVVLGNCCTTETAHYLHRPLNDYPVSDDRLRKIAAGKAFLECAQRFCKNTSPWGMLTGVRPAKVASEIFSFVGNRERTEEILHSVYDVSAEKASLCTEVSLAEKRLIPSPEKSRKACSIYIAIPFCPSRCAYCSFVSFTSPHLLSLIPDYLDSLCADIEFIASEVERLGFEVASVYIGGGTPTTLDEFQLDRLLTALSTSFGGNAFPEFTVEAGRPDTITREKLAVLKDHEVTRISVNTQTLNDDVLRSIGRSHSADDFYRAYEIAKMSGIPDINVDLIAALPGETPASALCGTRRITDLAPRNITVHSFSVKKSAELRSKNTYDSVGEQAKISLSGMHSAIADAGYLPYYMYRQKNTVGNLENVGFSLPGSECMYNIFMMEEVHTIFAAGASSVTKFVRYSPDGRLSDIKRIFEPKYPYEYLREHSPEKLGERRKAFSYAADEFFGKE